MRALRRLHSVNSTSGWIRVLDETSAVAAGDSRTGVGSVARWTDGVVVSVVGGKRSSWNTSTDGAELSVLLGVLVLATEETTALAGARGVVVAW